VNLGAIDFFRVPTDRGWMRDSGPICVRSHSGEVAYTHWLFNGWAKYSNYKKDAVAVTNVNKKLNGQPGSRYTMVTASFWKAAVLTSTAAAPS